MLNPFPHAAESPLTCLPLWEDRKLLSAPVVEGPAPITPNRLASVFRSIKKKNRKRSRHARTARAKNRN